MTQADNEEKLIQLLEENQNQVKGFVPYQKASLSYAAFEEEKYLGGITATIFMNTMHVALLAVTEKSRGRGIGQLLLETVEHDAESSNCKYVTIHTQDYQALDFYQKRGYQTFGQLPDCPFPGTTKYYLAKELESTGEEA